MKKTKFLEFLIYLGIPNKWSRLHIQYTLESKAAFFEKIKNYYSDIVNENLPNHIVIEITEVITNFQYISYQAYWEKYPKSRKRYSVFVTKDLENPFVYWKIMDYLKMNYPDSYVTYASTILKMSEGELIAEEERKDWYDTK